jgi:hypothetical protein
MSTVPENIYNPARLVASWWTLQRLLPATSVGIEVRKRRRLGAVRSPDQKSESTAGSSHTAALGLSKSAQPVLLPNGL